MTSFLVFLCILIEQNPRNFCDFLINHHYFLEACQIYTICFDNPLDFNNILNLKKSTETTENFLTKCLKDINTLLREICSKKEIISFKDAVSILNLSLEEIIDSIDYFQVVAAIYRRACLEYLNKGHNPVQLLPQEMFVIKIIEDFQISQIEKELKNL